MGGRCDEEMEAAEGTPGPTVLLTSWWESILSAAAMLRRALLKEKKRTRSFWKTGAVVEPQVARLVPVGALLPLPPPPPPLPKSTGS